MLTIKPLKFNGFNAHSIFILLLLIGIFLRFSYIGSKVYSHDEAYTSLRISGYTKLELLEGVGEEPIGVTELQRYQRPNQEKGVIDTIRGLAIEEPQLTPLYFVLVRFWAEWLGNSVATIRSLSALMSVLAFPCLYWLCRELFNSALTGWVAIALIAVSPLHVLYAQEARPYSLWIVTILLSSACLLQAMRLKTKLSWTLYGATVSLSLYSFLFSGLVVIAHGMYVTLTERLRCTKTVVAYLLASFVGILTFIPWILFVAANFSSVVGGVGWTRENVPVFLLIQTWILNLSRIFFDVNHSFKKEYLLLYLLLVILSTYSIYFVCCKTTQRVWLFIVALIGFTFLSLAIPDLIIKDGMARGKLSGVIRYEIPFYLGVHLAIAYFISSHIMAIDVQPQWRQKLGRLVMVILISFGFLSCMVASQSEYWWNKYSSIHNPEIARVVNQTTRPMFVTDSMNVLALSYLFEPKVRIKLLPYSPSKLLIEQKILEKLIQSNIDSNVFLYFYDTTLLNTSLEQYNLDNKDTLFTHTKYIWSDSIEPIYQLKSWVLHVELPKPRK